MVAPATLGRGGSSKRPESIMRKSIVKEGTRTTRPAATETSRATRTPSLAAASSSVRPGRKSGLWASGHPTTMAATATAADARAGS